MLTLSSEILSRLDRIGMTAEPSDSGVYFVWSGDKCVMNIDPALGDSYNLSRISFYLHA